MSLSDNDWPVGLKLRAIDPAEELNFPATEEPSIPKEEDELEVAQQLYHEMVEGHPAWEREEPDYEPIDASTDEYA